MASAYVAGSAGSTKFNREIATYSATCEGTTMRLTHKTSSEKLEIVTFDTALFDKFMAECDSGMARAMLRQWKSTTIDAIPILLLEAEQKGDVLTGRELQSLAGKIDCLYRAITGIRDSIKAPFFQYEKFKLS